MIESGTWTLTIIGTPLLMHSILHCEMIDADQIGSCWGSHLLPILCSISQKVQVDKKRTVTIPLTILIYKRAVKSFTNMSPTYRFSILNNRNSINVWCHLPIVGQTNAFGCYTLASLSNTYTHIPLVPLVQFEKFSSSQIVLILFKTYFILKSLRSQKLYSNSGVLVYISVGYSLSNLFAFDLMLSHIYTYIGPMSEQRCYNERHCRCSCLLVHSFHHYCTDIGLLIRFIFLGIVVASD